MNTTETNTVTSTETKRSAGRPKAVLKYPRGSFTFAELFELNRGEGKEPAVCQLTVRNHIKASVKSGFLTRLEEKVETGKPGQPALRYIRTAVKKAAEARAAARSIVNTEIPVETPVSEASLVEPPVVEVPAEAAPVVV